MSVERAIIWVETTPDTVYSSGGYANLFIRLPPDKKMLLFGISFNVRTGTLLDEFTRIIGPESVLQFAVNGQIFFSAPLINIPIGNFNSSTNFYDLQNPYMFRHEDNLTFSVRSGDGERHEGMRVSLICQLITEQRIEVSEIVVPAIRKLDLDYEINNTKVIFDRPVRQLELD